MRRPQRPRALSLLPLFLLALGLLAACGGGASARKPFEQSFPTPEQPGGDGGGGTSTPPPTTPQQPVWDAAAYDLGRTALFGSFSSDLVRFDDALFAVDADAIETAGARIVPLDISGAAPTPSSRFAATLIRAADLVDSAGSPGDASNPIGFGYFVNDIQIVSATLGFALVNAGGSDSVPTLSNLIVFNPTTGAPLQTLPLHMPYFAAAALQDSTGLPVPSGQFLQSGAEALAWIPLSSTTGRLFVAMSNLVFGAPSYGAVKFPGTVQVLDVDLARGAPVTHMQQGPYPSRALLTQRYNPVALATIEIPPPFGTVPIRRLLVTCAGTTGYDAAYNLVPVTDAAVESYDVASETREGTFVLGKVGLAAVRPALGTDAAGHRVGFYPSAVTGEVYLLRLDGLYEPHINAAHLAVVRGPFNGIPIAPGAAGGPGGNITGIGLSPDGRTLAVAGFGDLFVFPQAPGRLFLLNLPTDLLTGAGFGTNFVPGATEFGTTPGHTLGALVLVPGDGSRPDVYTNVSGSLDMNFLGSTSAALGSLRTFGLIK